MKHLLASLLALAALSCAPLAQAQVVGGTFIASGTSTPTVTISDGTPHAIFGFLVTAPVAGFAMLWPSASAPSAGAATAPICVAAEATPSGSYAATVGMAISVQPSVMQNATVAFSSAVDCNHYTPYATNTQITVFYQ